MSNLFSKIKEDLEKIIENLAGQQKWPADLDLSKLTVEPPRDPSHGDMATNVAMILTKQVGQSPRDIAALVAEELEKLEMVTAVEVAGPGFINLRLDNAVWFDQLRMILELQDAYGQKSLGEGKPLNVEYVSTNPTGPIHVGHTRGSVVGDVLANLMAHMGYEVTREYYINDGGAQVIKLAQSVYQRYLQAAGHEIDEIPEGLYPGEYLMPVGEALFKEHGDRFVDQPESEWLELFQDFAVDQMMTMICEDLAALGVHHDVFTSEKALIEAKKVEEAIAALEKQGLLYTGVLEPPKGKLPDDWEERPQLLFKSTAFGDDLDRPLKKSDGSYTYFANDIANHYDKIQRTGPNLIDVMGADHGGYVKRIQSAVSALTDNVGQCHVILNQMIRFIQDGKEFKMSKRAGTFVSMRDVLEVVGKDALRFMIMTRKHDQQMDFDFEKVKEQTRDNPVFYVQYAHARCCSVLRHAAEMWPNEDLSAEALMKVDLSALTDPDELALMKTLANYPRLLEQATLALEPHRLAFYLQDVASAFHGLWNKGHDDAALRFLQEDDKKLTLARLALVKGVAVLVASCLKLFGVTAYEEMH